MNPSTPTALITGASAGIGAAFARHLAAEGYALLLVARRAERLEALADELAREHGVHCETLAADLTDPAASQKIIHYANDEKGLEIEVLINNAGLSRNRSFADAPWEELAGEIQLMITAVTELAHRVLPGMRARGRGYILNLSSIAAFVPPPKSLLYTAIKRYVLDMSQALDMELKPQGIHVTALCPGFTYSEFHDVMGTREDANRLPGFLWQQPEDVVREGWNAVVKGRPVCVPGAVNKFIGGTVRPLPVRLQYYLGRSLNPFQ